MKKCLLLLLLGVSWSANAQSQNQAYDQTIPNTQAPHEPLTVQSPNAASLGLYGEVPVSLYTGLPSIEVPLYTVEEGKLTLPISLTYHASGFRPDVHPGWVGMGWTLQAGGTINRTIHDGPDEYSNVDRGNSTGYYFQGGLLDTPNPEAWHSLEYVQGVAQSGYSFQDTEPDEYSFNFNGYSGKFYLTPKGTWKVKCNRPITVTTYSVTVNGQSTQFLDPPFPVPTGSDTYNYPHKTPSKTFAGFIITTEDGTQYVFGGVTNAIEYQIDFFTQIHHEWVANSWNLTQIIHVDGHRIDFTYERIANEFVSQMYIDLHQDINRQVEYPDRTFVNSPCNSTDSAPLYYTSYAGKLIAPVYLSNIKTSLCTIYFDRSVVPTQELRYNEDRGQQSAYEAYFPNGQPIPNTNNNSNNPNGDRFSFLLYLQQDNAQYPQCLSKLQWRKLDKVRITTTATLTKASQPIKSFIFGYNDSSTERLTLLQITEQGTSLSAAKPPYQFEYNNYHSLPGYLTDQVDHWGFYNQRYIDTSVHNYVDVNSYYAHREPNTDPAVYLMGMLTRIRYPTGGTTDFVYEQHKFGKQLAENRFAAPQPTSGDQPAGGVRIKKIINSQLENPAQSLTKEYLYGTGYTAGNNNTLPSSGVLGGRARYLYPDYAAKSYNTNTSTIFHRNFFSSQSVLPASNNSQGSHIGYSTVVEKRSDGSYTQYSYSNFDVGINGDLGHLDEAPLTVLQADDTNGRYLYAMFSSTDEERGKLLQEDNYNSAGQRVKQKITKYVAFNKNSEYVPALSAYHIIPCQQYDGSAYDEGVAYKFYTYSYLPVQETETIYDPTGGNPVTTVKNKIYSSLGYRLVSSESLTDSKNQTLTIAYRYPFDITFPVGSTPAQPLTDPVASTIYAMTAKNIIGSPIETITTRNGLVTSAVVQTYRLAGPSMASILPFQYFNLEAVQPINQYTPTTYGTASNSPLIIGGGIPQMQLKTTFTQYDTRGNLLGLIKNGAADANYNVTGGTASSYLWSYQNTLPLAKVENALPNEVFHSSFEDDKVIVTAAPDIPSTWYSQNGYLKFEAAPSYPPSTRNTAHTGQLAAAMYTSYKGEIGNAFSPTLTIIGRAKRFVFSGWVYTNGPAAQIYLFMNQSSARNGDGTINYYDYSNNNLTPAYLSTNVTGQWVYLEQEIDVPANATLLTLRLTNFWNGAGDAAATANGGGVWFDDVRIHPADAQMMSYTHAPLVGLTSMSDSNNHPVYYEYDELNRLWLVRDQNRNIVKHYQYHYQR